MTNEEAIKILISDRDYLYTNYRGNDKPCYNEEAYTIAIKALEDRPKGKWIFNEKMYHQYCCSECGLPMPAVNDYYRAKIIGCPYCLADMRGDV